MLDLQLVMGTLDERFIISTALRKTNTIADKIQYVAFYFYFLILINMPTPGFCQVERIFHSQDRQPLP